MNVSESVPFRVKQYLWAVGAAAAAVGVGKRVGDRYQVVAPQIWLDTQPDDLPEFPETPPEAALPYLLAHPHRLHVPGVYGVVSPQRGAEIGQSQRGAEIGQSQRGAEIGPPQKNTERDASQAAIEVGLSQRDSEVLSSPWDTEVEPSPWDTEIESPQAEAEGGASPAEPPILLLDNAPIDRGGKLYPTLQDRWADTVSVRQLHWLWQLLELWTPLKQLGLAASLLERDNIRVEGWRVRLRTLQAVPVDPALSDLLRSWQPLLKQAQPPIAEALAAVLNPNNPEASTLEAIAAGLNQLLLKQTGQLSIQLYAGGATTAGPLHKRNEDACYPNNLDKLQTAPGIIPNIAIVCDGLGGHEGGEVASQMVVRSLQLQLRALLREVIEQPDYQSPTRIAEQIEAAVRVVNNLIAKQNDSQGRSDRQRMGSTLTMALQLPQRVRTAQGWVATTEVYIAHVGDSRVYWITPSYCHLLTLDDDIASREVIAGRSLYLQAKQRPDAGALTQAIGTRESDALRLHIQRFIIDEEGLLLVCSDGLSDNRRVEESWANYIGLIVKDIVTLEAAVESLIELANQKNGHDNASVVLMRCRVSPEVVRPGSLTTRQDNLQFEMTEASKALLYGEIDPVTGKPPEAEPIELAPEPSSFPLSSKQILGAIAALVLILGVGWASWWFFARSGNNAPPDEGNTPTQLEP
ncbi:MAG: protein phosphatase 2C domain-containing protein [Cyanobacteria bacterium P01_A01_bin.123]